MATPTTISTDKPRGPFETKEGLVREYYKYRARQSLLCFSKWTFDGGVYQAGWHHRNLCKKLDLFAQKKIKRLMVFMPPRHGKSQLVSRHLPAFILGHNPNAEIIGTSYGIELARKMNRDVQRIIGSPAYRELFPDTKLMSRNVRQSGDEEHYAKNADEFEVVAHRGKYKCSGVGGGITGMGFDFGIIDDPIKDRLEANSKVYRDRVYDWYTGVFYTRQSPDAGILVTLTRWHENDLAGRLIEASYEEDGEEWEIINYPAIAEEPIAEDDPREAGDALWPEKFDEKKLRRIQVAVGSRDWGSLYQQRPKPEGGDIFHDEWYRYYGRRDSTIVPEDRHEVQIVGLERFLMTDLAISKKDHADFTVLGVFGGAPDGALYMLDMVRTRMEGPDIMPAINLMMDRWKCTVGFVEDVQFQKFLIQLGRRMGARIRGLLRDSDKVTRAVSATPHIEAGLFYLPERKKWTPDVTEELGNFPNGTHDDIVDVVSDACNYWQERLMRSKEPIDIGEDKESSENLWNKLRPGRRSW